MHTLARAINGANPNKSKVNGALSWRFRIYKVEDTTKAA
jgi:hypothetical protein